MNKTSLLLATGNSGKVREFEYILGSEKYDFLTFSQVGFTDEIVEDGSSFADNAKIKAEALGKFCRERNIVCCILSDDSGLEVDALGGEPGVHTARYAGIGATDQQNWEKLLHNLQGIQKRTARFRCSLCWKTTTHTLVFEGTCEGQILTTPRGSKGFGYDPVFQPYGHALSFAEMDERAKKFLSHRGQAIRALQSWLANQPL